MCLYKKDKSPFHLIMLPDQALKLLVLMHDYPLYFQSSIDKMGCIHSFCVSNTMATWK